MHSMTPGRVGIVLLVYAMIFLVFLTYGRSLATDQRKTYFVIALGWAVSVFVGNYLLYRAGVMSFLPWLNNFMHTFLWIGLCLSWLYLGVRDTQPLFLQVVLFIFFSLVVKITEQLAFGTWEHPHFFWVLDGNHWYVLGWSVADGLYPLITRTALRFFARRGTIQGLKV